MRVLYASHLVRDPSKGAAWADLSLVEALRRRGHAVEEIWDLGSPRRIRHDNLHLLLEAPGRCAREVVSRVELRPFDVVLINQPLGWKAGRAIARRWPSLLYVARSHGWEPRVYEELAAAGLPEGGARGLLCRTASALLRPLLHAENLKVVETADGVVVGSVGDRAWMTERYGVAEERILAMPPGIAGEFLATSAPPVDPERLRRLLYVGQFAPFKAPEVAADAMARVLLAVPDSSATWVCASAHHDRVRELFPAVLRDRLRLLDWMSRDDLVRVYDESGIYFFPSYFEGFGQSFLEAMARGMVVLASRTGGMREAIRDGENGFLFASGAAQDIAARGVSLVADMAGAAEIGRRARRTAEGFTWDASAEKFERFVLDLKERRGH